MVSHGWKSNRADYRCEEIPQTADQLCSVQYLIVRTSWLVATKQGAKNQLSTVTTAQLVGLCQVVA